MQDPSGQLEDKGGYKHLKLPVQEHETLDTLRKRWEEALRKAQQLIRTHEEHRRKEQEQEQHKEREEHETGEQEKQQE